MILVFKLYVFIIWLQFVSAFLDLHNRNVEFLGCERIIDRTEGLLAKDKTYYTFTFNLTVTKYTEYKIQTCEVNEKSGSCIESEVQISKCQLDSSSGIILCNVIKGSVYPYIKIGNNVKLQLSLYGKNESGDFLILQNDHKYKLCELRGCRNTQDIVEFSAKMSWNPATKQYQIPLENIPINPKSLYDKLVVEVLFSNTTHKFVIETRNLTETIGNKAEEVLVDHLSTGTCVSDFNQVCVVTYWTYCQNNKTDLWKSEKRCQSFNHVDFLPKFNAHCSAEESSTELSISLPGSQEKSSLYNFVVTTKWSGKSETITTKNLTILLHQNTEDAAIKICDECSCSADLNAICRETMANPPSESKIAIIAGVVGAIIFVLVLMIVFVVWKKRQQRLNDNNNDDNEIKEGELPLPRNGYTDPDLLKDQHESHKYYDVSTQEEYELN